MPDSPRVSQRDIAAKAGVSVMTVSRALRNDRMISKAECQRIRTLAGQMGYATNPFLSTWMRHMRERRRFHERETIALISFHEGISKAPWFMALRKGGEQFAQISGYRIDIFNADDYMDNAALFSILRNRGIRGVILAPMLDAKFPEEAWQHSIVAISHPRDVKNIDVVDTDHYDGMVLALSRLTEYGFRRIAYWPSILNVETHKRWEAAYRFYQLDISRRNRLPVFSLNTHAAPHYEGWVRKHRPDVILCSNNHVYFHLQGASSPILQQVSWVSLNRDGISNLAGIDMHIDMLGEAAARMVTRKMELNEIGPSARPRSVFIRPEWADGETLRMPDKAGLQRPHKSNTKNFNSRP